MGDAIARSRRSFPKFLAHRATTTRQHNNDADNGLALSPTAHALFDMGLWSATDDFHVLVKPESVFKEVFPAGWFSLRAHAGRPLFLASAARLRPNPRHLARHRNHFSFPQAV
ncbi:MAG: hypothetical protein EXS37_17825 [Opitutus sp.]|nr:hypothetical protein [Opitutus sp.]